MFLNNWGSINYNEFKCLRNHANYTLISKWPLKFILASAMLQLELKPTWNLCHASLASCDLSLLWYLANINNWYVIKISWWILDITVNETYYKAVKRGWLFQIGHLFFTVKLFGMASFFTVHLNLVWEEPCLCLTWESEKRVWSLNINHALFFIMKLRKLMFYILFMCVREDWKILSLKCERDSSSYNIWDEQEDTVSNVVEELFFVVAACHIICSLCIFRRCCGHDLQGSNKQTFICCHLTPYSVWLVFLEVLHFYE